MAVKAQSFVICDRICLNKTGTWEQKFPKEGTHYRNFRINEKNHVRVPMMSNKANYLAAADHELECDILQVRHSAVVNEWRKYKVAKYNLVIPSSHLCPKCYLGKETESRIPHFTTKLLF